LWPGGGGNFYLLSHHLFHKKARKKQQPGRPSCDLSIFFYRPSRTLWWLWCRHEKIQHGRRHIGIFVHVRRAKRKYGYMSRRASRKNTFILYFMAFYRNIFEPAFYTENNIVVMGGRDFHMYVFFGVCLIRPRAAVSFSGFWCFLWQTCWSLFCRCHFEYIVTVLVRKWIRILGKCDKKYVDE